MEVHTMSPAGVMPMTMDDGTDDDDMDDCESAKSAISNASDFEDAEEAEYLAMDLINHLPPEQASKLMKNMRAKERAVQDLLHRNRSLLSSCQKLDEENQSLTDRLQSAEEAAAAASSAPPAPAAAAAPAAPAPGVDTSFFAKLEKGKEEKILRLQKERDSLSVQCKRLDEGYQRLEQALTQTQKELKKLQQLQARGRLGEGSSGGGGGEPRAARNPEAPANLLDEEERIYQELQGTSKSDAMVTRLQQKQDENKKRVHAALQAMLSEDHSRIERWGSDVAALLLAVDGMEAVVRPGKDKSGAKKGKAAAGGGSTAPDRQGERLQDMQAQLLDDCDALRNQIEAAEKLQLAMEQTARGVHDGADAAAAAMEADADAHIQVQALTERLSRLASVGSGLDSAADSMGHLEASLHELLCNSPPGLLPRNAEECLREARRQLADLGKEIAEQAQAVTELQDAPVLVEELKALHRADQQALRRKAAEEIRRMAKAFEQPLEPMRQKLRQQSEVIARSRGVVSGPLEQLAAALRRSAAVGGGDSAASGGAQFDKELNAASGDAITSGLREVRQLGRALVTSLEEGGKALEGRLDQAYTVLLGEPPPAATAGGGAAKGRPSAAGGAEASTGAEAKKKKGKKKGKGEQEPTAQPGASRDNSGKAETDRFEDAVPELPKGSGGGGSKSGTADVAKEPAASPKRESRGSLKGAELLHEMESLKNETEALEARMAERFKAKAQPKALPEEDDALDDSEAKPAPKSRKKKMFV